MLTSCKSCRCKELSHATHAWTQRNRPGRIILFSPDELQCHLRRIPPREGVVRRSSGLFVRFMLICGSAYRPTLSSDAPPPSEDFSPWFPVVRLVLWCSNAAHTCMTTSGPRLVSSGLHRPCHHQIVQQQKLQKDSFRARRWQDLSRPCPLRCWRRACAGCILQG